MGEYRNTFRTFAARSCDPREWEGYFLRFDPSEWDAEGDGVLQYFSDTGLLYSLVICHWNGLGFLLELQCTDSHTSRTIFSKYAMDDANLLDHFEERDDLRYPTGCFLPPTRAWPAVEDFLLDAERPSGRVQWVDDANVPWPDW